MSMFSPTHFAAYLLSMLSSLASNILSYIFTTSPPKVLSLLGGFDNGLLYALNPCAFLTRCQQRYGLVYRLSLGHWQFKVVSSGGAISSVLASPPELLCNERMHQEMFYVVAGVRSNFAYLHNVMVHQLFPFVDKTLSPRSLGHTTQTFGLELLSNIKEFARKHADPISLTQLTNEPLYNATNTILLGGGFPADTYQDFRTLSKSVPYRFSGIMLWRWPSYMARRRLLSTLKDYLQQGEGADGDDHFSTGFMKAFKENNIQSLEGAQLVLNFLWGVHSNTLSNSLFLLSFLLRDSNAFERVRSEIDSAVAKFGNLEALLAADPLELDDSSFQLLTSAIMETLRLTALHIGIRQASRDFDLKVEGGVVPIKEGEFVFGNAYAAHMDETNFPNPKTFVVDRFAQHPYKRNHLVTEGYPFYALGGGRHICKGRWLAIYQIKVHMIILLHIFNFRPAGDDSAGWSPLRAHPRSMGVVHTEDDIFARLSPRQVEEVEL